MATWRNWDKIKISGRTLVSNFSSIDCTDKHYAEYRPEQLVEPGQVLADFGSDYYSVILDHFEGEVAHIRVDGKVYKVEPGLRVDVERPLSYAGSETVVYVEPPLKGLEEIFMKKDASEQQIRDAIDWCMEHPDEAGAKMLESAADHLYLPKYRILDHQLAKVVYALLADRPDCPDKVRYKCYCRLARIAYRDLQADEGEGYAAKASEICPDEIVPKMLGVDYEWFMHREDYSELYRHGKLPRIKALVDARCWQAMAYLLDKIIPLQDEGMRAYAELCETVLKETYRRSGETNYDAIAPVALWTFIGFKDIRKFAWSWYDDQLIKGIENASYQAMYYYAFIQEVMAMHLIETGNEKGSKIHINKAMGYYRNCVDSLDRRAMAGLVCMMTDYDPDNPDLPHYIACLRAFSYRGQEYPCIDGDDDNPEDEYPDDDGRFDAYA